MCIAKRRTILTFVVTGLWIVTTEIGAQESSDSHEQTIADQFESNADLDLMQTIEASNGRICLIDGVLNSSHEEIEDSSSFAGVLRARSGYSMMADAMDSKRVRQVIQTTKPLTILAVSDQTLAGIDGGSEARSEFVINQLVIPGRYDQETLASGSTRWLLPSGEGGPTCGWAVRIGDEGRWGIFQIGPEGLPAKQIQVNEFDIEATGGIIHLIGELPKTPSMTRGALLEQEVCRQILRSALERSQMLETRDQRQAAIEIFESVLDGQAAATYSTASICKSYLASSTEMDALPSLVPASTFTILNAGFASGLLVKETDAEQTIRIYRNSVELALATLQPKVLRGAKESTAVRTLRDRLDSYREAVDMGRFTLRLRDQPDTVWLGNRDVFAPGRGDLGQANPKR